MKRRRFLSLLLTTVLLLSLAVPMTALAAGSEFTIENGVLTKYNGPGGDVTVPAGVTAIGDEAFYDCKTLKSVTLPQGLTSIGKLAFCSCESLASVSIPEGVTSIGLSAFYGCESLKTITLPASVTTIDAQAFRECDVLERIVIPNGVSALARNMFSNCYALKSVKLPEGLTSIGDGAFDMCKSLTDVNLPSSLTTIGEKAFSNCESLESALLPDSVTSIGESAFLNCYQLKEVHIPQGVTTIATNTFQSCKSLTSVSLPQGVTSIGDGAFYSCSGLTTITLPEGVTSIGASAFYSCTGLTSVTLPGSLSSIGNYAFYNCSKLTSVNVPQGTTVGKDAFQGTSSLKTDGDFTIINGVVTKYLGSGGAVKVPEGVTAIGASAFSGDYNIISVTLPNSLTAIENYAFSNCGRLTSVTLPASLTSIGNNAFHGCKALTNLTIPAGVTHIGNNAFRGTPWFEKQLGNEFTIINGNLLAYNGSGGKVTVPDGVREIRSSAFSSNEKLTEIIIPDSVVCLGDNDTFSPFYNCTSLERAVLGDGITELYNTFSGCSSLTDVTLPANLRVLGMQTFSGCSSLTELELPDSLEEIGTRAPGYYRGGSAFQECGLTTLELPEGLKKLDDDAFRRSNLTSIVLPDSVEQMGYFVFADCPNLTSVTFPKNETFSKTWKWHDSWDFWNQVFLENNGQGLEEIPLKEIVNCPSDAMVANIAANQAVFGDWVNPGKYLAQQSERIVQQSNAIVTGISGDYEKAAAIYKWVIANIAYDWDYLDAYRKGKAASYPVVVEPEEVLEKKITVCDGYSKLTAALLQAQGIPAAYILGTGNGEDHAWNAVYVNGEWILVDSTWGRQGLPGGEFYNLTLEYFDIPLARFSSDHKATSSIAAPAEDTPSGWAQSEVRGAIAAGLVPNDLQAAYGSSITREEFCRLMVRLVEQATDKAVTVPSASPFTDTNAPEVLAAHALGIVNGTSETTFTPAGSITRQEAAAMLARTAKALGLTGGQSASFADEGSFASWAAEGIAFVSGLTDPTTGGAVMGGTGNGSFSPTASYSREQAILTALRLFHIDG